MGNLEITSIERNRNLSFLKVSTQRQTDRQTDRQIYRQTDRQTDRQIYRQTDRQTDRYTDRQSVNCLLDFTFGQMLGFQLCTFP